MRSEDYGLRVLIRIPSTHIYRLYGISAICFLQTDQRTRLVPSSDRQLTVADNSRQKRQTGNKSAQWARALKSSKAELTKTISLDVRSCVMLCHLSSVCTHKKHVVTTADGFHCTPPHQLTRKKSTGGKAATKNGCRQHMTSNKTIGA